MCSGRSWLSTCFKHYDQAKNVIGERSVRARVLSQNLLSSLFCVDRLAVTAISLSACDRLPSLWSSYMISQIMARGGGGGNGLLFRSQLSESLSVTFTIWI